MGTMQLRCDSSAVIRGAVILGLQGLSARLPAGRVVAQFVCGAMQIDENRMRIDAVCCGAMCAFDRVGMS